MRKIKSIAFVFCGALLLTGCESEAPSPSAANNVSAPSELAMSVLPAHVNLDVSGTALGGHDPVAYHNDGVAVPGKSAFVAQWNDARWLFSSAENRDTFSANPERYAPANGGFCTFGVVLNKKFDGDPTVWTMEQGRLHLFLNEEVKRKFYLDKDGNLARVERNWPQIKDKSPMMLGS